MPKTKNKRFRIGTGDNALNLTFPFVTKRNSDEGTFWCHVTCRRWVTGENREGRVRASTGIKLKVEHWDIVHSRVSLKFNGRDMVEGSLDAIVNRIRDAYTALEAKERSEPSKSWLKPEEVVSHIRGEIDPHPQHRSELITIAVDENGQRHYGGLFGTFLRDYRSREGRRIADMDHHKKNFDTLAVQLCEMINKKYPFGLRLNTLDDNLDEFGRYWLHHVIYDHDYAQSSIEAMTKRLKQIITWSMKQRFLRTQSTDCLAYSATQDSHVAIDDLTFHQILSVQFDKKQKSLESVRDAFALLCLTALRYNDLHKLFTQDAGLETMNVQTSKIGVVAVVPVFPKTREILMKYRSGMRKISNQAFNRSLKKVFELAGLTLEVEEVKSRGRGQRTVKSRLFDIATSHMGRRTFISNCLAEGIADSIVMKCTGHTSRRQLDTYTNITDKKVASAFGGNRNAEGKKYETIYTLKPVCIDEPTNAG